MKRSLGLDGGLLGAGSLAEGGGAGSGGAAAQEGGGRSGDRKLARVSSYNGVSLAVLSKKMLDFPEDAEVGNVEIFAKFLSGLENEFSSASGAVIVEEYLNKLEGSEEDKIKKVNLALFCAAYFGNLDLVRHLKEVHGANHKAVVKDTKAIRQAAVKGRQEIVDYLINLEIDPEKKVEASEALFYAAAAGNLALVKHLKEVHGANHKAVIRDTKAIRQAAVKGGNCTLIG